MHVSDSSGALSYMTYHRLLRDSHCAFTSKSGASAGNYQDTRQNHVKDMSGGVMVFTLCEGPLTGAHLQ